MEYRIFPNCISNYIYLRTHSENINNQLYPDNIQLRESIDEIRVKNLIKMPENL